MDPLSSKLAKYLPNWSKPILGLAYRNAKFDLERTKRRLHLPSLPVNKDNKVYIHLGCGEVNAPGFINVDTIPFSHVHYVQQVEDLRIFPSKYAELIYASHVLEHISHREVAKVLTEWYRVLKEGGILRLSVPDFDKLLKVYLAEERDIRAIIMPLIGGRIMRIISIKRFLTRNISQNFFWLLDLEK